MAEATELGIVYDGTLHVGPATEFKLPVRIAHATGVGAVSLILNFPEDLVEVLDVNMDDAGTGVDWLVDGNQLRIGWFSQNPFYFNDNDELFSLDLKTTAAFTTGNMISISLAADPLNEIADQNYETVRDAVLSLAQVEFSALGIYEPNAGQPIAFSNYPNPFHETTTFNYTLPANGRVTLEIRNLMGSEIISLLDEYQQAGNHSLIYNPTLPVPGVYMATLRLISNNDVRIRTLKLVKEQ
jgi:hypothetical protein